MPIVLDPEAEASPLTNPRRKVKKLSPQKSNRLVAQVMERYRADKTATLDWRRRSRRAFSYYESAQIPVDIAGKPEILYVVLNITRGKIDTKHGILFQAKPRPEVTGRGMEDSDVAAVMKDLVGYRMDEDGFDSALKEAGLHSLICGLGVLEEEFSLEVKQLTTHGMVPGNLRLSVGDPLRYYPDARNRTWRFWGKYGPRWYTVEDTVPLDDLIKSYPALKARLKKIAIQGEVANAQDGEIGTRDSDGQAGFDRATGGTGGRTERTTGEVVRFAEDTVQVLTHWYTVLESKEIVLRVMEDGTMEPAIGEDGKPLSPDLIPAEDESEDEFEVVSVPDIKVCTCAVAVYGDGQGGVLLYDRPTPYKHGRWPAVFISGTMYRDQPLPYGEVDRMFDIQDLFNKLNSLMMEHAIRGTKSGGVYSKEAFTDEKEAREFEERSSTPGTWTGVRGEFVNQGFKEWQKDSLPQGLFQLQTDIRILMDEVSNLHQTQRGGMPYDTSGRAIIALQQAGDVALELLKSHIEWSGMDWGQKCISNIQQYFTWERAFRISDQAQELETHYQTEMRPNPEDDNKPALALFRLEVDDRDGEPRPKAEPILNDMSVGEYDVRIVMGSGLERSPEEKREQATQVYNAMVPIAPNTALEYLMDEMEVRGRKALLQRIQEESKQSAMLKQVEALSQDPQNGPILRMMFSNPGAVPELLRRVGVDPAALEQAVQPEA